MSKSINLIGRKFERLLVLERYGSSKDRHATWLCLCDCGNRIVCVGKDLISGHTKSCGCLAKEKIILRNKNNKKHGFAGSFIYKIYDMMMDRCINPKNKQYKDYGGRGITICERWANKENGLQNFLKDIGEIPKGLTLDRTNNDGNYEPNNWRLATRKQQNRNKRNNRLITYKNKTQCLAEWAEEYNLKYMTLYNRIYRSNWPIEKALTVPVKKRNKC